VDGVGDLFAGVDSFPIARRQPKGVLVSLLYANVWALFSARIVDKTTTAECAVYYVCTASKRSIYIASARLTIV
jgi:hypothetical protein